MFSVSADGTLAYIPRSELLDNGALLWVNRKGESSTIVEIPRVIDTPRVSHDGRRIAFRAPAPECNIWVHDLESGVTSRVTHEGDNHGLTWSSDDARLIFARLQIPEQWGVMATAVQGTGGVERLSAAVIPRGFVSSVSPDGEYVLAGGGMETGADDIYLINTKDQSVKPLLNTSSVERAAAISPDGKYVAYVSEESGRAEIYVQSFPSASERHQVSADGGSDPVWSRDGKELFFRSGWKMMVADVASTPTFTSGRPRMLFETKLSTRSSSGLGSFDVSPDGQRFLMVRERSTEGGAEVNVVLNWFEELKALAPKESN
jgi:Tol biopolymer transport system component